MTNFFENNQIFHIIWKQATIQKMLQCYIVTLLQ